MLLNANIEYINPTQYCFEIIKSNENIPCVSDDKNKGRRKNKQRKEKHTDVNVVEKIISAPYYPDEWEFNYIAKMVFAENQTESDSSCRAVIDILINRVRSNDYPDTYYGCITQVGQYETWSNGMIDEAPITSRMAKLVEEELNSQTFDYGLMYFTAGYYNPYCLPAFNIGNVYFGR